MPYRMMLCCKSTCAQLESAFPDFSSNKIGNLCKNTSFKGVINPVDSDDSMGKEIDNEVSVDSGAEALKIVDDMTQRVL